jgi:hypothetical protein
LVAFFDVPSHADHRIAAPKAERSDENHNHSQMVHAKVASNVRQSGKAKFPQDSWRFVGSQSRGHLTMEQQVKREICDHIRGACVASMGGVLPAMEQAIKQDGND